MTADLFLSFDRLNLDSLSPKKPVEIVKKTGLNVIETIEVFEYEKYNERYWDGAKFYKQMVDKALLIAETF